MSKKDKINKDIDEILDEIKFWRNVLILILSGIIGIIFSYSQHKIVLNIFTELLLITGSIISIFIIFFIYALKKRKHNLHKLLEKEE